jgi:hypothetical protein
MKSTVFAIVFLLSACSSVSNPPGGETLPPFSIKDQLAEGKQIYTQSCATADCHGSQGEGIRAGVSFRVWPLVGSEFQERNPNAQVIFDVVRSGSEPELRALTDQQVYNAIAYELSLNRIDLDQALTAENALSLASGPSSLRAPWGTLFPPPGNAVLLPPREAPTNPLRMNNGRLALRVGQFALASAIDGEIPPEGGYFAILVFSLEALARQPLEVDPQFLLLYDNNDQPYEPANVELAYPIELFHHQTIQSEHSTSAAGVFMLSAGAIPTRLVYDDRFGRPLEISLR